MKTDREVQETASELKALLDEVDYHNAFKALFKNKAEVSTCDTNHFIYFAIDRLGMVREIESLKITERQKLSLRFFLVGDSVSAEQIVVLVGNHPNLMKQLAQEQLVVEDAAGAYRLNDLCINSYYLRAGKPAGPMYIVSDIPKVWSKTGKSSVDMMTVTSLSLLKGIEARQAGRGQLKGCGADLGSGGGVQSIALLRMNPELEVYGVEIEPHAMELSRFNAMLNGVRNRFAVVDNRNATPKNDCLAKMLEGKKLSIAVSNPPFNLVPEVLGPEFTRFGYGGPDGLKITRELVRQGMANLAPDGEFLIYSQFGIDKAGHPLFEKMLQNELPTRNQVTVSYKNDPMEELRYGIHVSDLSEYAGHMISWIKSEMPASPVPSPESFEEEMRKAGVEALSPRIALMESKPASFGEYFFIPYLSRHFDSKPSDAGAGTPIQYENLDRLE